MYDLFNCRGEYVKTYDSMEQYFNEFMSLHNQLYDYREIFSQWLTNEIKGAQTEKQNQIAVFDDGFIIVKDLEAFLTGQI